MARAPRPEYLVLDIETIPDVQRWQRPPVPEGAEPPFPPTWAHRIIVVGYVWLDGDYRLRDAGVIGEVAAPAPPAPPPDSPAPAPVAVVDPELDARERALLVELSRRIGAHRPVLVTYNGRSFDLPVIALRSLCHAIPLPWYYRDRELRYRYSDLGHLDLCDWLADHGAVRAGKLDAIARLIGLPGKGTMHGSQVEGMYHAGQLHTIQRYCLADVAQTAFLFLRFRLLQGRLGPDDHRARAAELLAAFDRHALLTDVFAHVDRDALIPPS